MRTVIFWKATVVLLMLLAVAAGCNGPAGIGGSEKMPLLFEADFEDGRLGEWQATDSFAWRIEPGHDGKVLALYQQSEYEPRVRSPFNINLVRNFVVGSFVLEVKMRSTTKDYGHRDMCLFLDIRTHRISITCTLLTIRC